MFFLSPSIRGHTLCPKWIQETLLWLIIVFLYWRAAPAERRGEFKNGGRRLHNHTGTHIRTWTPHTNTLTHTHMS